MVELKVTDKKAQYLRSQGRFHLAEAPPAIIDLLDDHAALIAALKAAEKLSEHRDHTAQKLFHELNDMIAQRDDALAKSAALRDQPPRGPLAPGLFRAAELIRQSVGTPALGIGGPPDPIYMIARGFIGMLEAEADRQSQVPNPHRPVLPERASGIPPGRA
jgi:hypothetical protein